MIPGRFMRTFHFAMRSSRVGTNSLHWTETKRNDLDMEDFKDIYGGRSTSDGGSPGNLFAPLALPLPNTAAEETARGKRRELADCERRD